jgi:CDP-4-dehydro-6-deoxyglucose reductase
MTKNITKAHILSMIPLTQHIVQIYLQPEKYISYQTGQYLMINELAFSIANAACLKQPYEIHFRHYHDHQIHQALLAQLEQKNSILLQLPYGNVTYAHLQPEKPVLMVAGGTGFSQMKALLEQAVYENSSQVIKLYWMVRSGQDHYMLEFLEKCSEKLSSFKYQIIYTGHQVFSVKTILETSLKNPQIVLSGPFEMVYHVRDQLLRQGISREQLFSDAFAFEDS